MTLIKGVIMNIGDFVFNNYHEVLRFGTIIGKTVEPNGWAFFTVSWHDDDRYEHAIAYINKLRNTNEKKLRWRVDELTPVDPSRISKIVASHSELGVSALLVA
jgi:hypothetical protein